MYLTPHFTLDELTVSQTAERQGLDNTPDERALANLKRLALLLETVRLRLGRPIIVTSGYRSPEVNRAVGGARTSQHLTGCAADFICPGFGKPITICSALADCREVDYDQLIEEGRWVHISWAPQPRRQVLTANFTAHGTQYVHGLGVRA